MKNLKKSKYLDFEIDKLTNSIEQVLTGEMFETEVVRLTTFSRLIANDWVFDWQHELLQVNHEIFKLITRKDPSIIHGLISITLEDDHVMVQLIESSLFNKGKDKLFSGVAGNLMAFACKSSFEKGFGSYVVFVAKTKLIEHYEKSLGAKRLYGNRMFLDSTAACALVRSYFKDFDHAGL